MIRNNLSHEDELNQSFYEYNGDDDDSGQNYEDESTNDRIVRAFFWFVNKTNSVL